MSAHARRYSRIREWRGAKAAASYKPRHRANSWQSHSRNTCLICAARGLVEPA